MNQLLRLRNTLAVNSQAHPKDVIAAKTFLHGQGLYSPPDWGITEYPDEALFAAIKAYQTKRGLMPDGVMKPDGETEAAIQEQARRLQTMGRRGDTLLAHITPDEAALLKKRGGSGTINPKTGLMEFFGPGTKEGRYTWRTKGDGKVRSSHAERDGKVYSWNDPPEGGHPGEAPNCRCRAEDLSCILEWLELREVSKELTPLAGELGELERQIKNTKLKIIDNEAGIEDLEYAASVLKFGGLLTRVPHPLAKTVGYAAQVTLVMVKGKLSEIRAELKINLKDLKSFEAKHPALKERVNALQHRANLAEKAYNQCKGETTH